MLSLAGELTIAHAAAQREALLTALSETTADVALDLSAIESCDSSGVQLLLAARRHLTMRGLSLSLAGCPPAVTGVLQTYGLAEAFAAMAEGST